MKNKWGDLIWSLDDWGHVHGIHWRWLCDYNDKLITGEKFVKYTKQVPMR